MSQPLHTESLSDNDFLADLINQYKVINPTYSEREADLSLDDCIISELAKAEVLPVSSDRLSRFVSFVDSKRVKLKAISERDNLAITKHPVMLVLSYLILRRQDDLDKVDLDYRMLGALASYLSVHYEPNR